jgi:stress response protein YsnF
LIEQFEIDLTLEKLNITSKSIITFERKVDKKDIAVTIAYNGRFQVLEELTS